MLSYHPDQRDIMLRISERLKEKGYKVWLAKSNSQSYPEHFMEAIENAAVVLVGISRKYKQTPSIFAGKYCSFSVSFYVAQKCPTYFAYCKKFKECLTSEMSIIYFSDKARFYHIDFRGS